MKKTIFGITPSQIVNFEDKFVTIIDDMDFSFYESKEVFTHEDDISFKFRMCIDVRSYEGKTCYILELVPTKESISEKKLQAICDSCCVDEPDCYDIQSYGCSVVFAFETFEGEDVDENVLNLIASVFETMVSLRGFYFDKPLNLIGTTGWDLLYDYMKDEDWSQKTFSRLGV